VTMNSQTGSARGTVGQGFPAFNLCGLIFPEFSHFLVL